MTATVTLKILLDRNGVAQGLGQTATQTAAIGTAGTRAGAALTQGLSNAQRAARNLGQTTSAANVASARSYSQVNVQVEGLANRLRVVQRIAGGTVLGVGLIATARQVTALSDAYVNYSSKLRLVTESEGGLARVRQATFEIAQRTRSDLIDTGELFARLTRATNELGLAEESRLRITETVNKAFIVSGATATEAGAAIVQLSQGLAAGALRGEEFNSVAEQAPVLLDLISKSLGRTRGELRAMAKDGALTAGVITGALLEGAQSVDAQFGSMAVTIGGATQQLKNSLTLLVGGSAEASGAAALVAVAIQGIAAVLPQLIGLMGTAVAIIGTRYAAAAATAVVSSVALRTATAANAAATLVQTQNLVAYTATQVASIASDVGSRGQKGRLVAATNAYTAALASNTLALEANAAASVTARTALLSLVGGPVGAGILAFAALAAAIYTVIQAEKAREAAHDAAIESLEKATGATADLTTEFEKGGDAAPKLSLAVDQVRANADQLATSNDALASKQKELDRIWIDLGGHGADLREEMAQLRDRTEELTTKNEALKAQFPGLAANIDRAATALSNYKDTIFELEEGLPILQRFALFQLKGSAGVAASEELRLEGLRALADAQEKQADAEQAAITQATAANAVYKGIRQEQTTALAAATDAVRKHGLSLADEARYEENLLVVKARAGKVSEAEIKILEKQGQLRIEQAAALDKLKGAKAAESEAQKAANKKKRDAEKLEREATRNAEEAAKALDSQAESRAEFNRELARTVALLRGPVAQAEAAHLQRTDELAEKYHSLKISLAQYTQALGLEERVHERSIAQAKKEEDFTAQALQNLRDEARLIGLTTEERIAEEIVMDAAASALRNEKEFRAENAEAIRAEALALQRKIQLRNAEAAIRESRLGGVVETDGNGRPSARLFEGIGDIISEAIKQGFKTGLRGFADVFRNFGEKFAKLSGKEKAETIGAAAQSIAAFAAQYKEGIKAYGKLDSLLHASVDAAASGAFGPQAQAVAQVVKAIDSLFGGRLLGTAFEVNRSGRNFAVGAGGVTGGSFVQETRQRSFFRGTQTRTTNSALDPQTKESLEEFLRQMQSAVGAAARSLGTRTPALIAGSFAETFDKDGKLISQIGTIAGRVFRESAENFQRRLTAENLIAVVGALDSTATEIAEHWRQDARKLLDGAQLLLAAQGAIRGGNGLLGVGGTLAATVALVEELAFVGEPLAEAFSRLQASTAILTDALGVMGISLDRTRTEIIEFAAGIAEAAGGVGNAATLWETYFNTFYSAGERAEAAVAATAARRTAALQAIGLDTNIDPAVFRTLFEAGIASFTAEQTVQWLRAAAAIAASTTAVNAAGEAFRRMQEELDDFMAGIDEDLASVDGLSLVEQFRDIGVQMQANILTATRLGATEAQLTKIRLLGARQARALIEAAENDARSLVERLNYGATVAVGLTGVANGIEQIGEAISSFRDNALLDSNLSPLSVREQYDEALRQLTATGDESTARRALELARLIDRSGQDYNDRFNLITSLVRPGGAADQTGPVGPTAEDQAAAQAQRRQDAQSLADRVADLALVQNRTFESVASQLGFTLEQLRGDLGLDSLAALEEYLTSLQADAAVNLITAGEARMIVLLEAIAGIRRLTDAGGGKPDSTTAPGFDVDEEPSTQVAGPPEPVTPAPAPPTGPGSPAPPGGPRPPGDPANPIHVEGIGGVKSSVDGVQAAVGASTGAVTASLADVLLELRSVNRNLRNIAESGSSQTVPT